jgi:hypothetical protein
VALAVGLLSGCWLQPGYGPGRQSFNRFETTLSAANVDTLVPVWSVDTHYGGQPLVSGDRVILGGTRSTSAGRVAGVQAFTRRTGAPAWERDLAVSDNPLLPLASGPTFSGASVWFGVVPSGSDPVFDTRFDRLDPAAGTTSGSLVETAGYAATPVTAGPIIAYTATDLSIVTGTLVVRDASTPSTRWTASLTGQPSGTVVAHGQVYVTAGTTLYAFAATGCGAATCPPTWTATVPGATSASVVSATDDGQVLVTAHGTTPGGPGLDPVATASLTAYRSDGTLAWQAVTPAQPDTTGTTGTASIQQVAVADDVIYAAGYVDGQSARTWYLRAYATAGCDQPSNCPPLWQTDLGTNGSSLLTSGLVVAGDVVYLGVNDEIRTFDAHGCGTATCAPLTQIPVDGNVSNLSVALGRLYVTTTPNGQPHLTAYAPTP